MNSSQMLIILVKHVVCISYISLFCIVGVLHNKTVLHLL